MRSFFPHSRLPPRWRAGRRAKGQQADSEPLHNLINSWDSYSPFTTDVVIDVTFCPPRCWNCRGTPITRRHAFAFDPGGKQIHASVSETLNTPSTLLALPTKQQLDNRMGTGVKAKRGKQMIPVERHLPRRRPNSWLDSFLPEATS